jgi:two-component system, NarL family, sensor histidine kinase UhpB
MKQKKEKSDSIHMGKAYPLDVVANSPGMVFQYIQKEDGTSSLPFISDQCASVLGISAAELKANPSLFLDLVLPEDRESLRYSKAQSAANLTTWNWEGRLWIESYGDIKWISLRASPRRKKGAGVVWEGIIINITEGRRRETELKESHERLKEVSAHVMAAREHERIRIAREIHDDLGGNLTAIKIDLDWLVRRIDAGASSAENTALLAKVRTVSDLVDRTIHSIQRISRDLRPGIMDFGIFAAIEWEASEFAKRYGIPCEVSCNESDIELEPDTAVAVFRIFQEALTNIAKHAHASHVWVWLDVRQGHLELKVLDNGCGIAPSDLRKLDSFGIRGMVERASLLEGKLTVSAGQGHERTQTRQGQSGLQREQTGAEPASEGTLVHLSIPLAAEARATVLAATPSRKSTRS